MKRVLSVSARSGRDARTGKAGTDFNRGIASDAAARLT